jgi:2,4-dienoyl-CoA reductase-like NADH-dependent reductase (Old Yellow Enzyme family)/NADPH-dependent 2,4-dienoyl-CoA reductase/sulfur reductase-like enzyme
MGKYERLFEPGKIGSLTLKNRLIMEPIGTRYADSRGHMTDRYLSFLEERAKGGVALITNEASRMIKPMPWPPFNLAINDDKCIPGLSEMTRMVKRHDTRIVIELAHLGIIASELDPGLVPAAPSPYRYHVSGVMLREMTRDEIAFIVQKHVDAAIRAKKAGYDGVNVDVAHGTLLHMFLTPKRNKRSDEYGGSLENRCRFTCEAIRGIREAMGSDFGIIVRMSGDDFVDGGITLEDAIGQAPYFVDAGADALDISAGVFQTSAHKFTPTLLQEEGIRVPMAAAIKKAVNVPIIVSGKLRDPAFMEQILLRGDADFIGLARPLLADPQLPNKIKEGRLEEIRPCLYCNLGCRHYQIKSEGFRVTCNVNPVCGIEYEYKLVPAKIPKTVMVIGGGLAGMEAAMVLAQRGHNVSLYEKEVKPGGQWNILASYRPEVASITNYLTRELTKAGAKVFYGTEVDTNMVRKLQPDAVVVATGARQKLPEIPGVRGGNVLLANDVLSGKRKTGDEVVILGAGLVGMETAVFLAKQGKRVSIVDIGDVGSDVGYTLKEALLEEMIKHRVCQYANASPDEISENGVTVMVSGEFVLLKADTVVVAAGSESDDGLYEQLKGQVPELHNIGDSRQARNSMFAIHEGFRVGNLIPTPVDADFEETLRG